MIQWLKNFQGASPQTKAFALTWIVFGLAILLSTLFIYGRLDYVRSDKGASVHTPPIKTVP